MSEKNKEILFGSLACFLKRSENFNKQANEPNKSVKELVDKITESKNKEKNGEKNDWID